MNNKNTLAACVTKQQLALLTNVIGHFVCAISEHPEEDSLSIADRLASFIDSSRNKYTPCFNTLHEDITCHSKVLPVT